MTAKITIIIEYADEKDYFNSDRLLLLLLQQVIYMF